MLSWHQKTVFWVGFIGIVSLLSGCGGTGGNTKGTGIFTTQNVPKSQADERAEKAGKLFGDDIIIAGSDRVRRPATPVTANGYLWRAALDTLSFLPLQSTDATGGVLITGWFQRIPKGLGLKGGVASEAKPRRSVSQKAGQNNPPALERLKVTVVISSPTLRTDGLQVKVFRQVYDAGLSMWRDASVSGHLAARLEDVILSRARELSAAGPLK